MLAPFVFGGVLDKVLGGDWQARIALVPPVAVIFLSLVVLAGYAGQISLCQAALGGVSAFIAAHLVTDHGLPFLAAAVVGALVALAIGAVLAWRATPASVLAAFVGLGVHSALLEGSQRSMLADLAGGGTRGTAYGFYYAVVGAALLPASIVGGLLWDHVGPAATFGVSAALALLAAALFAGLLPARDEHRDRNAQPA